LEDLIANEGVIITLTHAGLIKRTNVSQYRAQRRGGKGVIGMATREGSGVEGETPDFIEHLFAASTHDYLMVFTNTGRVYVERVHEIPDAGRVSKGRSIANLLQLKADEKVAAMIRIEARLDADRQDTTWEQAGELFFATRLGTVKKTSLNEFGNVRKDGIIAINIEPGDALIQVKLTRGGVVEGEEVVEPGDDVVLITHNGMSIRFSESDVRSMGRAAAGVKGITLETGDEVVALAVVVPDATLLVAGENGIGKRTAFDEYLVQAEDGMRKQSRGGKGRITMKITEKTGGIAGALTVRQTDEIMLITAAGQMVRTYVRDIRETGRNAMGVKLIDLDEGDRLQAIAPVIAEESEEESLPVTDTPAPAEPEPPGAVG
jgi:DNA gyrase subunit A